MLKHPTSQSELFSANDIDYAKKIYPITKTVESHYDPSESSQISFGFQQNPSKNKYYNRQAGKVKYRPVEGEKLEPYVSQSSLGLGNKIELEKQLKAFQKIHQQRSPNKPSGDY